MQDTVTHHHLTLHIVRLAASDPAYAEVAGFADVMAKAAVDEDERPRFLNHFYDPDTKRGLPVSTVFELYEAMAEGPLGESLPPWDSDGASFGSTSSYTNALDWARDRGHDGMNWLGALQAYSESPGSKAKAYEALGHVLHLLEDMGQPDHVSLRAHPWEDVHKGMFGEDGCISYESLMLHAFSAGGWNHAQKPRLIFSLEEAFDDLARLSRSTERSLGLPRLGDNALGVRLWAPYLRLPPDAATRTHLTLAQLLLPEVEAFGAGLVQLFLRIVNPPPFLREVRIDQGGVVKYHKRWETEFSDAGRATSRRLVALAEETPLDAGVPAEVHLSFGPGEAGRPVTVIRAGMEEGGAFTPLVGGATPAGWRGTWTPSKAGVLVVEARDAGPHHEARPEALRGHLLQSTPEVPARVDPWDPLAWKGYAPGADRTHGIQVKPGPCVPASFEGAERERLRWGEFRGGFRGHRREEQAWALDTEKRAFTQTSIEAQGAFRVLLAGTGQVRGLAAPLPVGGPPPGPALRAGPYVEGNYHEKITKQWFDAFRPDGFDRHNPDIKESTEERSGPLRGGGGSIAASGYRIAWPSPSGTVELAAERVCEGPTLRGKARTEQPLWKRPASFTYHGHSSEWEWDFTFTPVDPPHAELVRELESIRSPGPVTALGAEVVGRILRSPAAKAPPRPEGAGVPGTLQVPLLPFHAPPGPLQAAHQRALNIAPPWGVGGLDATFSPGLPWGPSLLLGGGGVDELWIAGREGEAAYAEALEGLRATLAARHRQAEKEREAWRKGLAEVAAIAEMVAPLDPALAADLNAIAERPVE